MLTDRQKEVLKNIIQVFDRTQEPVGSKTLLEESGLQVSSATIRNDMAQLEEVGLIKKTHQSSGRIPSYEGYRYYTDRLIESGSMQDLIYGKDQALIEDLFKDKSYNPQQISKLTSDLMSSLTQQPVFVFNQDKEVHTIDEFKLFSLDQGQAIGILVTNSGHVVQEVFELPQLLDRDSLNEISQLLTNELHGAKLDDSYQRMKLTLPFSIQRLTGYQLNFSSLVETAIYQLKGHSYFVSGRSYMFDLVSEGGFDTDEMKVIFNLIEGSNELFEKLEELDQGIRVIFGRGVNNPDLIPEEISLITGTYYSDKQKVTLGIIGRESMSYDRHIPAMNRLIYELASYK